jgi:hypothetical protein
LGGQILVSIWFRLALLIVRDGPNLRRANDVALADDEWALRTMWSEWMNWLARHARSRYVRLLEAEVERLRAENRSLVNSLLGTAGFPPVSLEEEIRRGASAMTPVRRRTWSQIAREREFAKR